MIIEAILIVAAFVAGVLVGRKNAKTVEASVTKVNDVAGKKVL
jgi:hypothetical protein